MNDSLDPVRRMIQALRLPVIVAPMFLVTGTRMVVAACREGVIGSFPTAYARTSAMLERWLENISSELAASTNASRPNAPWAANLIVHPTNSRAHADFELLAKYRAPIVIASVGNASRFVSPVHDYGGLVFADVASVEHARKAARSGIDALILLCGGAGGHTGWMNPFAFVPAVREFFDKPIILAGSISDGAGLRAAQALGAELSYVGTRFIATLESDATEEYRQLMVSSTSADIVLTSEVSGLPANWLRGSLTKLGYEGKQQGRLENFSADANFTAWRDIWGAGHGVGAVKRVQSVADVVAELECGFSTKLQ